MGVKSGATTIVVGINTSHGGATATHGDITLQVSQLLCMDCGDYG